MGLVSISLPSDGSTADVADYNVPITTLANLVNGNLDTTNIASVSGTDITAGTLPGSALDATTAAGYITGLAAPNTVTALGNRSYSMVFNSVNYSTTLSAGMRLRTTRTVAAPTQCTSLNGTTQYYSKSSPAGMTFTDDFTAMGWVKLSSYQFGTIISRIGATSGWALRINASGQVNLIGGAASTYDEISSYQSLPLNKWVHVVAHLDISGAAGKVYLDGVEVPSVYVNTAATAITQQGNLEVGSANGATFLPGKVAQAAVFSAVLNAATIQGYYSQGLIGTETNLISAYSFNGVITDLNTTNANNLTANGSAVATNADSPFGGQADGSISSTLDYADITSVTFSTNTTVLVEVMPGNTIPTSGGVSSVVYSSNYEPYGKPAGGVRATNIYNPYKFSVGRAAAYTTAVSSTTAFPFDSRIFDTNSNVDTVTNKGRFTAPVSGFYFLTANVELGGSATAVAVLLLGKNGTFTGNGLLARGNDLRVSTGNKGMTVSTFCQLGAGEYVEVGLFTDVAVALDVTTVTSNLFSGYLVSAL